MHIRKFRRENCARRSRQVKSSQKMLKLTDEYCRPENFFCSAHTCRSGIISEERFQQEAKLKSQLRISCITIAFHKPVSINSIFSSLNLYPTKKLVFMVRDIGLSVSFEVNFYCRLILFQYINFC